MTAQRIAARFAETKAQDRAALVAFIMGGDPDHATSARLLQELPKSGADIIELAMPFSDPMADGPAIQAAGLRALQGGANMIKTFALARGFRAQDQSTPLILMGYFNPILAYGPQKFLEDAHNAGVDGFIVVDLPPEEDGEFRALALKHDLAVIHLATPTTDEKRLPRVLDGAGGFLYYVSIAGITGTKSVAEDHVREAVAVIRRSTSLPIAVGFGVRTPDQARSIATHADGVIVGSALVDKIAANLDDKGQAKPALCSEVGTLVKQLAAAVRRKQK